MMYDHEKSDPAIVAVKPTNKSKRAIGDLGRQTRRNFTASGLIANVR